MDSSEIKLLRALAIFLRERSVSRAGEVLHLSQPAASHILTRLRKLFGDPLLLRSRNGMVATERALAIGPAVARMLAEYDRLTRPAVAFDHTVSERTFHVSAPEFAESMLIPHLLRMMRSTAPNVRVNVHAPPGERALELMESGELDIRIAWLIPAPVASLRSVRLFNDRLVCIADRNHAALRGGMTVDLFASLPNLRTIGYSQTTTGRAIERAIARHGKKAVPPQIVQTFATMLRSIPGTDLIAIVPRLIVQELARRNLLKIHEPPIALPTVRYTAYWHERNQHDAGHRWFRALIAEAARTLREEGRGIGILERE